MAEALYTAPEIAKLLGVHKFTVYRACNERRLGHYRIGDHPTIRIPISAYKAYLERNTHA